MSKAVVLFVGNKLMLDDGIGPACHEAFLNRYQAGDSVDLIEVGCLTADLLSLLGQYDFVLTVDAVNVPGFIPGTLFSYAPSDMARLEGTPLSLHDLKLVDLFDMALLCGYECEGFCLGMQIGDADPAEFTVGLTQACSDALGQLCDAVAFELNRRGYEICEK